jgi:hypothetical protein
MPALLPQNNPMPSPASIRNKLLDMAGINTEVQAKLVRRSISTMARHLRAKKPILIQNNETQEIELVDDNMAQLRAAEGLARLMGVEPSKDINQSAVKVVVEVKLPDWAKPVIDVTAASLDNEGSAVEEAVISRPSE